jgi:uncharacterized protein
MFPLGSVLFPHMPLQLRVFEERYIVMLSRILQTEPSEFGVVLIERGQEVGGGERRFGVGTIAQVTQLEGAEGFVGLIAEGSRRIEVIEWLDDDPHPQARVRELPELEWSDELLPLRLEAEQTVRRALAVASEFVDQQWAADVEVSDDPVAAAWQLAAIAPLAEIDQIALLASPTMDALLKELITMTTAAEEMLRMTWPDDLDELTDDGDSD